MDREDRQAEDAREPGRTSLATRTLLRLGVGVLAVVVISGLLSYLHVASSLQRENSQQLARMARDDAAQIGTYLRHASSYVSRARDGVVARLASLPEANTNGRFDRIFERLDDGTFRTQRRYFEGFRDESGFYPGGLSGRVGSSVSLSPELRGRIVEVFELVRSVGAAGPEHLINLYVYIEPDIGIGHWPEVPWELQAPADLRTADEPWRTQAGPAENPDRAVVWSEPYYEEITGQWMLSCLAPIYLDDTYIGMVGGDLFLNEIFSKLLSPEVYGTTDMLFTADGRLVAHPMFMDVMKDAGKTVQLSALGDSTLLELYKAGMSQVQSGATQAGRFGEQFVAADVIEETGWILVTEFPRERITEPAARTALGVLTVGLAMCLVLLFWQGFVLRVHVVRPLKTLIATTRRWAGEDSISSRSLHPLPTHRPDELGELSRAFLEMNEQRWQAFEDIETRSHERAELLKAARAVMECPVFEDAARRIFDACREATGARSGYVALLSDDGEENEVLFLEAGGMECTVDPELPMPIRGLRAEAYESRKAVYDNDFMHSEHVKFMPEGHVRMKNVLFAPLIIGEQVVGVMGLANKPTDFTDADARIAEAMGDMAAVALRRARTEEALRASQERYAQATQAGRVTIWRWDPETDRLNHESAFWESMGYSPEQAEQNPSLWRDIIYPGDVPQVFEAVQAVLRGEEEFYDVEHRMVDAEGRIRWVHARGGRVDGGLMAGTVQDITRRRNIESQLAHEQDLTRRIADTSPEGIVLINAEGRISYANRQAETLLRLETLDEDDRVHNASDWTITDFEGREFPPDQYPFHVVRETLKPVLGVEQIITWPDGSSVMLSINCAPMFNTDGAFEGMVAVMEDVTRREQTKLELQRREAMLARAERIAHVGSWEWDIATDEVEWSEELFRIFGLDPAEGAPPFAEQTRLYTPGAYETIRRAVEHTIETGEPFNVEADGVRSSGEIRICRSRGQAERDAAGKIVRLVGSFQDVTDQKQAEADLAAAKEQAEQYLNVASVMFIALDTEGRVTLANPKALEVLGFEEAELLGRNWFDTCLPADRRGEFLPIFRGLLDGDVVGLASVEGRVVTRDGQERIIAWHNTILRDAEGKVYGTLSSGEDITDRKRAEADREVLEARLAQAHKMEAIGRLAGGVAHDFNNKLQAILGYAHLLLDDVEQVPALREPLEEIRDAARRSADLTTQLLAFARKQTIAPKVIDLNAEIVGMLKMFERLIGEDIELNWHPGASLWPVKMDPAQIDQVLANLVVNARDAIDGTGQIIIETHCVSLDAAYCQAHAGFRPGDYVLLSVSDTGAGMDEETLRQVFEPFFTTKSESEGTGLGLATVYGIVKQNDGFVNVYSEPGHGTIFKLYLPRESDMVPESPVPRQTERAAEGTETVLLVEDDRAVLSLAKLTLERLGYQVLATASPTEAIELAEEAPTLDLLITDVVMPEFSGRDLLRKLHVARPDLKCLFMSGYTANVIAHRGILDDSIEFIQKPFALNEFAAKIREVLDG